MSDENDCLLPDTKPLPAPKDKSRLVYLIFYIMGVGSLLPWNFFITANGYFQYKLRNTSLSDTDDDYLKPAFKTHLQVTFENYIALVANIANCSVQFLVIFITNKISMKTRINASLSIIIVLFLLTVTLVFIDTDAWQEYFFIVTMVTVAILSAASAVFSASTLGLSSLFPPNYMQASMSGQALGGVLAVVANILSIVGGNNVLFSAFGYFLTSTVFSIITILCYTALGFLEFSKFYINKDTSLSTFADSSDDSAVYRKSASSVPAFRYLWKIFKRIWLYAVGVFLVLFVTLSIFPGIAANILSVSPHDLWTETYFTPVVCFLLFNVGDLAGRTMAGWIIWPSDDKRMILFVFSILRLAFIPLIIFCNVQPRDHIIVYFSSDVYPIVFLLLVGLTNGYTCTLLMMYGPTHVLPHRQEIAGVILSWFMSAGLFCGAVLSLLIMWEFEP